MFDGIKNFLTPRGLIERVLPLTRYCSPCNSSRIVHSRVIKYPESKVTETQLICSACKWTVEITSRPLR